MGQIYKVFINDCELIITHKGSGQGEEYTGKEQLSAIVNRLENQQQEQVLISGEDPEMIWRDFKSLFKIIEAAGGLVFNAAQDLLMIYRLGRWDLPKGKIEPGEIPAVAAEREVQEECGIGALEIVRELTPTYHTYRLKGEHILKRTYWFLMKHTGGDSLTPQIEEDITEVCWCNKAQVAQNMKNTYGNIKLLLKQLKG